MNIKKDFEFLINDYGLKYNYKKHTPFGNWIYEEHSFYNENGCFTISNLLQRDDLDFYFSDFFCDDIKKLHNKRLKVSDYEKELWENKGKFLGFNIPFYWSKERVLSVVKESIKAQIDKSNEFFSTKIKTDN